jgi:hypothetical protein
VVEDGQEDAAEDEAVVLEENLSDEDEEADVATSCSLAAVSRLNRYINTFRWHDGLIADSAGPVKWVVPAWEVLAADRGGWKTGLKRLKVNETEVGVC